MARIFTPWTPSTYDLDSQGRSLGFDFVCDTPTEILGVWWFQETGSGDGPLLVTGRIYLESDHSLVVEAALAPSVQGWNLILFEEPFLAEIGVTYTAAVWLGANKRAGYTFGIFSDGDILDESGHTRAKSDPGGRYGLNEASPAYPDWGAGNFLHGVDIEFQFPTPYTNVQFLPFF